jgi:hypothetical protein
MISPRSFAVQTTGPSSAPDAELTHDFRPCGARHPIWSKN